MDTFAGWVLVLCAVAWLASDRIIAALIWLDRHNEEVDAVRAADHGEPTRTEIEAPWTDQATDDWWLFDDPAFIDRPTEAVMFAAAVMATIDELPEVAS